MELLRQNSTKTGNHNTIFFNGPGGGENRHNISFNRLVETSFPLSYGGIHNSAVKTVAKLIWESFAIQAFHQVSLGAAPLALVPSVYALRANGKKIRPTGHLRALWRSPPISVRAPRSRKMPFSPS